MAEASIQQTNLSEEDPVKLCDPCMFSGVQKQAGAYCQVCSEYLCDTCGELHRRFKATREHELTSLDESSTLTVEQKALVSALMTCALHTSETITHFCLGHELVICYVCQITAHRKCQIKSVQEMVGSKDMKSERVGLLETSNALVTEFDDIEETRLRLKAQIQSIANHMREEIENVKTKIIVWAEKLECDILDNVEKTENALIGDISAHIRTSREMTKQLKGLIMSIETLDQDVPDALFVLLNKARGQITQGEEIKRDLLNDMQPISLSFHQNDKLETLMSKISAIGTISVEETFNFLQMSIQARKNDIRSITKRVTGCVFLPNGELVICDDSDHMLRVFTPEFALKHELKFEMLIWDVAVVSNDEIVVTEVHSKSLQYLQLSNNIHKGKSILVGQQCWGVDFKDDKIYVSCDAKSGMGGDVKILQSDGTTLSTFEVVQGKPHYLAVNNSGERIALSMENQQTVLCFNNMGHLIFAYTDEKLGNARGILFDSCDNFIVCGKMPHNIHTVKKDGSKHSILASDDIDHPYCCAYRPSDKTFIVGQFVGKSPLLLFTASKI